MRKMWILAALVLGFGAIAVAAEEPGGHSGTDQPTTPAVPPASGTTSSDLSRSGGIAVAGVAIDRRYDQSATNCGKWFAFDRTSRKLLRDGWQSIDTAAGEIT
jgi:hypothetical protein